MKEIVFAAGFGVGAGHVEAAEGVGADHGAGAFAIQIKIADVEGFFGFFDFLGIFGVDGAGKAELRVVGDFQRLLEVFRFDDSQNGAEDFFLGDARFGIDVGDDRRLHEVAVAGGAFAAEEQLPFLLTEVDVTKNRFHGGFADDRAHVVGGIFAGTDGNFLGALDEFLDKGIVDFFGDDGAGAGRTFLALIAEGRLRDAFDGGIDVGFFIDDGGVLAAQFENGALDPQLAGSFLAGVFADEQADFLGASKSDVAGLGMFYKRVAGGFSGAGEKIESVFGNAGFIEKFHDFRGDQRRFFGRF